MIDYVRYVEPWEMTDRVRHAADTGGARAWRKGGRWCTVIQRGKPRVKIAFDSPEGMEGLIDALARRPKIFGKRPAPSSYGWPWMHVTRPPRPSPTSLSLIAGAGNYSMPRPWNEAITPGNLRGVWTVYDLRSAYAWAGMQPLPDVRRSVYCDGERLRRGANGLYLVTVSRWGAPLVPSRLRHDGPAWVTREELDAFDAHNLRVLRGVEWTHVIDLRPTFDMMRDVLPYAPFKRMCRAYWGAWISRKRVEEWRIAPSGLSLSRFLPARHHCPPWAWIIMARVSLKCAQVPGIAHVFTDSVMTQATLRVGSDAGDWQRERTLVDPWIAGTGLYGDDAQIAKRMGVGNGALRAISEYRMRASATQTQRKVSQNAS